ncbi:MAG: acyl transferase [Flavobacteriales bacterium]|nr:acyl transferase [Flavobacteriales bacterium]
MIPRSNLIFSINSQESFNQHALDLFHYQAEKNQVYRNYVLALGIVPNEVVHCGQIPFLPISFFKTHEVKCGDFAPEKIFTSSGTSGQSTSSHWIKHLSVCRNSLTEAFRKFYGEPSQWCILALLPSYMERSGSSLIYMVDELMKMSEHPMNGFFLDNLDQLHSRLHKLESAGQKTLLIGVTFALMDFAEKYPGKLNQTLMMETGGMKGRREELTREEVHTLLNKSFGLPSVHSEYGMTELLSQAYSRGNGLFQCPPWMQVSIRDVTDPFSPVQTGKTGGINVMDLANKDSCAFVATDDLGRLNPDGNFEVLGRFDHADVRGCNLLVV